MAYQNINQYVYKKWYLRPVLQVDDISLASDERQYNEEVVFSPYIIGVDDGNVLPVKFDLNFSGSNPGFILDYGEYNEDNILISSNYYNDLQLDLSCFGIKKTCDIGLTGTDNGLVDQMTGKTIEYTSGLLNDSEKFDRLKFDRRLKFHQVTGFTWNPNHRFSGVTSGSSYEIVSYSASSVGIYHELYGGFYQGFYELFGYDYQILPERYSKGWTVEMTLKPRITDLYYPPSGVATLNDFYPNNSGIFFYLGTRAENKYWHPAKGKNSTDPDYERVTHRLTGLSTCECTTLNPGYETYSTSLFDLNTSGATIGVGTNLLWEAGDDILVYHDALQYVTGTCLGYTAHTGSLQFVSNYRVGTGDFIYWRIDKPNYLEYALGYCTTVYPPTGMTNYHYTETPCYTPPQTPIPDQDAAYGAFSNALAIRFSGDPRNPKICIRTLTMTGDCITSGTCETLGFESSTGYSINNYCSTRRIYDDCSGTTYDQQEHWVLVDFTFERYSWFDECDLFYRGGLGTITTVPFTATSENNSVSLISPPITHYQLIPAVEELVQLNNQWLLERPYRNGRFILYVNGKLFQIFENVEEIIPRGLYGPKETQIGVPFNMSWGGGTQGLHENLVFSGMPTSLTNEYIQDPELFPPNILSATTLSALTTNILIEQNFAGSFDGGISSFNMYAKPLSVPEVQHNARILRPRYNFLNPYCLDCSFPTPTPTATVTQTPTNTPTNTQTPTNTPTNTQTPTDTVTDTPTPTPTPTPTVTETSTSTPTPTVTETSTSTPTVTPTNTETPTQTVTPTNTETPTQTVTPTNTETPTQTVTPTNTETPTQTVTPTNTETPTPTQTNTPTGTETPTPTTTNTETPTQTPTNTQTATNTPSPTSTPSMVLSGLLIELDANNNSSYPGSGSDVYNLQNIGTYTHTLTNAPYTEIDCVKCFDCNGVSNTFIRVNGTGPTLPTSGYTYITWGKVKTSSATWRTLFRTSPNDHPILVEIGTDSLGFYDNDSNSFKDSGYDVTSIEDVWVQYSVVGDSSSSVFYINGTQVGTTAFGAGGNKHDYWGSIPGQPFGYVANMYFYDRKLTLSEITQQYDFLSNRFNGCPQSPTPTPTNTETPTQTPTMTETGTQTPTPTNTETPTPTNTETPTQTPTNTETGTPTPTPTVTETGTPTPTPTHTVTPTNTITPTPSSTLPNDGFLLQENYSMILQEDGSGILIEPIQPTPTPTTTQTPTPTSTVTPTITPTNTPNLQGFSYSNFASTSGLTLLGNASVSSNIIFLTTATNAQVGNVYRTTAIRYDRNFSTQWSTLIGGGTGADGYCVQWTSTNNSTGTAGGGVGLIQAAGTINAITFLTFTNNSYNWYKNNVLQSANSVSSGLWRQTLYFWGDYNHSAQTFDLYWNTINSKPVSPNKTFSSFSFDSGSYYMGFGGATGGSNDNHEILNWSLTFN